MMKKLAFVGVVLAVASLSQAVVVVQEDMVLTIDYVTGAATIKNMGTVAHKVYIYQIQSSSTTADLNPGTRATTIENPDPAGDPIIVPSSPGTWLAISDSLITNAAATTTALSVNVASYAPFNPTQWSLSEGTLSGYANFKANGITNWSIGNPVLAGKASASTLKFFWNEVGMTSGNTYLGKVVILNNIPEPATMSVLVLGAVGTLLRKRRNG